MKKLLMVLLCFFLFTSCGQKKKSLDLKVQEAAYVIAEKAYFEGQKDALQKDIRIEQLADGSWCWIKSPWNSGKKPIFDPINMESLE